MKLHKSRSWVLGYEGVGFGMIIVFSWLREFTRLGPLLYGGESHERSWRDPAIETLLIMAVWGVVFIFTNRLLGHVVYLEGFLRVCSWCRKIGYKDTWIPLEEYFRRGFHVGTTHGVCPECFEKLKEETSQFRRKDLEP